MLIYYIVCWWQYWLGGRSTEGGHWIVMYQNRIFMIRRIVYIFIFERRVVFLTKFNLFWEGNKFCMKNWISSCFEEYFSFLFLLLLLLPNLTVMSTFLCIIVVVVVVVYYMTSSLVIKNRSSNYLGRKNSRRSALALWWIHILLLQDAFDWLIARPFRSDFGALLQNILKISFWIIDQLSKIKFLPSIS